MADVKRQLYVTRRDIEIHTSERGKPSSAVLTHDMAYSSEKKNERKRKNKNQIRPSSAQMSRSRLQWRGEIIEQ